MSRVAALLKQHDNRNKDIFKLEAGEGAWIRFMPPYDRSYISVAQGMGGDMDPLTGICQCRVHGFLPRWPLEKSKKDGQYFGTNWRCQKDLKQPCPFCEFFDELGKPDAEIKRQHGSKMNAFLHIFVKELGTCKKWFISKTVMKRIGEIYDTLPNIGDPQKGRNVYVKRRGTKFDTEYDFKVSEKETRLPITEDQYPDDITSIITDFPVVKGPNTAMAILKAAFPGMI